MLPGGMVFGRKSDSQISLIYNEGVRDLVPRDSFTAFWQKTGMLKTSFFLRFAELGGLRDAQKGHRKWHYWDRGAGFPRIRDVGTPFLGKCSYR